MSIDIRIHRVTEIRIERAILREGTPDAFHTIDVVFISEDGRELNVCAFTGPGEIPITGEVAVAHVEAV